MPLHDHPNMCIFFQMFRGKLRYSNLDKLDSKFKYNRLTDSEYQEYLEQQREISAKINSSATLEGNQMLVVRPSVDNLHEFFAEEDTCFLDICLPGYQNDISRKITYFKELPHLR